MTLLATLLFMHVLALHSSIAGMELFGWLTTIFAMAFTWGKKALPWRQGWIAAYVGLVLATLLSLLLNPSLKPFWLQFGFMRFGFLVFGLALALQTVWSQTFEQRLLKAWLAMLGLAGTVGLIQCLTGFDWIRSVSAQGGVWRAQGFFSLSLTYAYAMGISWFALSSRVFGGKRCWFSYSMLALGALGIVASMSRGAWLAMLVCAILYLALEKRRLLVPFLVATAVFVSGLALLAPGFGDKISGLLHARLDHSSEMRVHLWKAYLAMAGDHPFFGVGIFQGDKLLPAYYERLGIVEPFVSHAHNNYLVFLAGTGALGLLAFLLLIGFFLHKAWRLRKVSPWGWGLFLAQGFLHLGGLTEANFIDGEVNHMLIFVWAMVLAVESQKRPNRLP